jgi:hypothetical protein
MGYVIECLVEAYALLGGAGRITTARPDSDVDHKDFIVDEVRGYRSLYLQVKGSPRLYKNQLRVLVRYPKGKVLSDPRLVYVFCYLDAEAMKLARMWLIPAPDFNRLAPRQSAPGGRVQLEFQAGNAGKWARFEIDPTDLGVHLLTMLKGQTRSRAAA